MLAAAGVLIAATAAAAEPLTWEALAGMVRAGARDEAVLASVRRDGIAFDLTFERLRDLRAAGRTHAFLHLLVRAAVDRRRVAEGEAAPPPALPPDTGVEAPRLIPDPLPRGGPPLDRRACLPMDWRPPRDPNAATALAVASAEVAAAASTGAAGMGTVATSHRIAAWQVLRAAGLHAAACAVAREALLHWSTPIEYACGLLAIEESRASAECPLADPALPARVDLSTLPSNAVATHLFVVGSDLLSSGRGAALGREMLRAVPPDSAWRASALRRVAADLLATRQYRTATRLLVEALERARAAGDQATADRTLLDLGRIAFENDLFDTAVHYYAKIDPRSPVWPRSAYERGWASLMAGHPGRALGAALTLRRLGLATMDAYPDLGLLRAVAYVNACMYPEARAAAEEALRTVRGLEAALAAFAPAMDSAEAPFDPAAAIDALPAIEREAAGLVASWRNARREAALLRDAAAARPGAEAVQAPLAEHEARLGAAVATALVGELRRLREAVFWTRARLLELSVDIDSEQRERLAVQVLDLDEERFRTARETLLAELPALARKGVSSAEVVAYAEIRAPDAVLEESDIAALRYSGLPSDAIEEVRARFVRKPGPPPVTVDPAGIDTRILWDFAGEFWSDELNGVRVDLPDRCGM